MARTKKFDPQLALSKAMAVFWEQGYTATSIQDLVEAMGIHRGSLYDTFQGKRQLFLEAIALYQDTIVQAAIAHLKAPGAARSAIERHFWQLAERSAEQPCGCLITNTLVELAPEDAELVAILNQGIQQVEDAFFQALVRAQDQGEIGAHQDIRTLAHYLTTSLQGLRVMSRLNPHADSLKQTIRLILKALD
ncbi:MAG: TetR/AcrR family transcriptional regulator [Leptolyngbya sp. SIOISBB]|nr:TetR/AcrR family transcriptional regulator [Leptolyngbya sp. SIOISBB]